MRTLSLLAMIVGALAYADPPKPSPEPPLAPAVIGFPVFDGPQTPPPVPVPQPAQGIPKLTSALLFVFDSEVECLTLCSPDAVVKVTAEPGPVKYHGRFIDQPDKTQTKTFTRKFIYKVEPAQTGRCELSVVAVQDGKVAVLKRQTIDVDTGEPSPDVPPDDSTVPAAIKAAYASEQSTYKHAYAQMLAGFYRTRCPQYVKTNATWGEFSQQMKLGRQSLLDNELSLVRQALEKECFKNWPTDPNKPVDPRTALDALNAAASALEKLR